MVFWRGINRVGQVEREPLRSGASTRKDGDPETRGKQALGAKMLDEGPMTAFEMVTRRGLDDLSRDFERLEGKVNGLIFGVTMTFLIEIWKAFR